MFKPGFPVQSRELTTLQSILQNQIEKFGQYFFKEGSMVIPGGISFDDSYFAVKLDPFFLNIPVKEYTKVLADGGIKIKGETSGVISFHSRALPCGQLMNHLLHRHSTITPPSLHHHCTITAP